MSERGILFSAPMVRALLAGQKTQTRRLYKPRRPAPWEIVDEGDDGKPWPFWQDEYGDFHALPSPFGSAGDRLWVRETWQYAGFTEDGYPFIRCRADDKTHLCERIDPAWSDRLTDIWAKLSETANFEIDGKAADRVWRPAIFMPRWASRIALEIASVRLERLQDISEADARTEGVEPWSTQETWHVLRKDGTGGDMFVEPDKAAWERMGIEYVQRRPAQQLSTARDEFARLWDRINGERRAWVSNPYVWVVTFRVVSPALPAPPVAPPGG